MSDCGGSGKARVIAVVGPTASGKTAYAVRLAQRLGGEIVSADSMQIYRHMDIGTAKPTDAERGGVRHHMLDVAEPNGSFSVAQYQKMALECLRDINSRGKRAIVAGGTGLYIHALAYNITYPQESGDEGLRRRLDEIARERGNQRLAEMLAGVDPAAASRIHVNDRKRLIRALEVYETTGVTLTAMNARSRSAPSEYEFELVGLLVERSLLYERINRRVDDMFGRGLLDEARRLAEAYGRGGAAFQAIGYKEALACIDGLCTPEEAAEKTKMESRRYAKRQMTWFRIMKEINWIGADAPQGPP
jgi:tRNA dimethylallyltransferase